MHRAFDQQRVPNLSFATALATLALAMTTTPAASAGPLTLGFNDDNLASLSGWQSGGVNVDSLNRGYANGASAGAREWRFMVTWNTVARTSTTAPSPATAAADPAWSGYVWTEVDRIVRGISGAGVTPIPWIARAPAWAEGANRPAVSPDTPAGTWRPQAPQLEQFAKAIARRYDGTYPDPERPGQALPKITTFQGWNEPNLFTEITPQWTKTSGKWKIESVGIYRNLINAFSRGIKASQPSATVLSAGTGPFGGLYAGDSRIQPARFYRELLCVKQSRGKLTGSKGCPKLRVDGWAHHTYPIGPPWRTARNADDVVVPDMPKLTRIASAAAKTKTLSTKAAKNVWMTEMSWESAPDPNGLDLETHAQYMQGAFYLLWKAGVSHVFWWNSRDNAKGSDWNASHQSGIFARGATPFQDTPKPAFTAFRFPFTAFRDRGVAQLWSRPPGTGPVVIEAETAPGSWKRVATLKSVGGGIQTGKLRVGVDTNLRAVQGTDTSLTWQTT